MISFKIALNNFSSPLVEVVVLWSEGLDQILVLSEYRDRNWIFSDSCGQNLKFPDFADRGNVSAAGATKVKLTETTGTEEKLIAVVEN